MIEFGNDRPSLVNLFPMATFNVKRSWANNFRRSRINHPEISPRSVPSGAPANNPSCNGGRRFAGWRAKRLNRKGAFPRCHCSLRLAHSNLRASSIRLCGMDVNDFQSAQARLTWDVEYGEKNTRCVTASRLKGNGLKSLITSIPGQRRRRTDQKINLLEMLRTGCGKMPPAPAKQHPDSGQRPSESGQVPRKK